MCSVLMCIVCMCVCAGVVSMRQFIIAWEKVCYVLVCYAPAPVHYLRIFKTRNPLLPNTG